jgi:hypothetical protein
MKKFKVDFVHFDGGESCAVYINGVLAWETFQETPTAEELCSAVGAEFKHHECNDDSLTADGKMPKHLSRIKGLE